MRTRGPDDVYRDLETFEKRLDRLERAASARRYSFRAVGTGSVSIPTGGAFVKFPYPTQLFDPDDVYDAANARFVAPHDGVYEFFASMGMPSPGAVNTTWLWALQANGSTLFRIGIDWVTSNWGSDYIFYGGSGDIELSEGDQITVAATHNAGGTLSAGSASSHFSGKLVQLV